jgi:two-component system sensor histidine kinase KdpD
MKKILFVKKSLTTQYLISVLLVIGIAAGCFCFSAVIHYRITALLLLLSVSLSAILFDILPVLVMAILSGLILNFFFIQPIYTFHITNTEDVLLFVIYLLVALLNAFFTFKIREIESKTRDKEEKVKTIKLYDTLLNSLSHELRTPISTIISAIDTLKDNRSNLSKSNQEVLFDEIDKASIRLNRQVENLLNMSRLESGMLKPKLDWCDVNELAFGLLNKLEPQLENHVLQFEPNGQLPLFKLDAGIIEEVIRNLLANALLYTPQNSTVVLQIAYQNDSCVITISDNGPGFPESEMAFVFDKFYRIPNTKTGGIGLGLSIVKGFIEAHNGTISLLNLPNAGACFTIKIPTETSFINHIKNE